MNTDSRRQISDVSDPGALYSELMDLIVRLARSGLIHGDFNEFNILIREGDPSRGESKPVPILIDFPQMVSTDHENAEYYFNRDVQCIRTFFKKRFRYESSLYPRFLSSKNDGKKDFELDVMVAASGFGKKEGEALERYMRMIEEAENHEESVDSDERGEETDEEESQGEELQNVPQKNYEQQEDEDASHSASTTARASLRSAKAEENFDVPNLEDDFAAARLSGEEIEEQDDDDDQDGARLSTSSDNEDGPSISRRKMIPKSKTSSTATSVKKDIQSIVSTGFEKEQRRQGRLHHGKKGITAAGRSKGSKRRSDPRTAIQDSAQF